MNSVKLLIAALCIALTAEAGAQPPVRKPIYFSAGMSVNPGLGLLHREAELGPAVSISAPVRKQWDAGFTAYMRSVWYRAPDRKHGYKKHIHFPYDKESVYALQLGYTTREKKWMHGFHLHPGLRLERYSERLSRPDLGIDETFKLRENNFFMAASYSLRRRIAKDQGLGIRLMLPFDRLPQDDINRYSLELNWYFIWRRP